MSAMYTFAKRPKDPKAPHDAETLHGHSKAVCDAFQTMFGERQEPTRLGLRWLAFFGVASKDWELFWTCVLIACMLHDMGKSNSGFQDMLLNKGPQLIRHEHLSALLLCLPELQTWIEANNVDHGIILSAVLCHHLKAEIRNANLLADMEPDRALFHVAPAPVNELLTMGAQFLPIAPPTLTSIPQSWDLNVLKDDAKGGSDSPSGLWLTCKNSLRRLHKQLRKKENRKRLLMAVRSALIVADSAGSGLLRENKPLRQWLETAFSSDLLLGNDIEEKVIASRIRQIEEGKKQSFEWMDFQLAADNLPSRVLLLSSCGSGKTLAAWRWIRAQLQQSPKRRVIFLYPTRATATEGFKDYVSWAPEADAALISGTATYELERMFDSSDTDEKRDARKDLDYTTEQRLFAVGYWTKRIFSSTVHQFLGFMQHAYGSTCLLPVLADSVVVFDEVHSFDKGLFSALTQFLKQFDVPALCMTATLPPVRQDKLAKECDLSLFPEDPQHFQDLQHLAETPRYKIDVLDDADAAQQVALAAKEEGKRVLWVVNSVDRCQELAKRLDALCYHSRFRLCDRQLRHQDIINAFKTADAPVLAVTTQVCEMSLDLDADVLITEVAPMSSLIQRMGRCNRHLKQTFGQIFCYAPPDEKPYDEEQLLPARDFIKELQGRTVSQNALAALFEELSDKNKKAEVDKYSAFLQSAPWASSHEHQLMETTDYTVQAILEQDLDAFYDLRRRRVPFDGLVLPAPKFPAQLTRSFSGLPAYLRVAPTMHYDEHFGFFKSPLENIS